MPDHHRITDASQPPPRAPRPPDQQSGLHRRLISLRDAAAILGLSVASVRRLIWSGRLHAVKLTRRVLVDLRDVDRLIEQSKVRGFWQ